MADLRETRCPCPKTLFSQGNSTLKKSTPNTQVHRNEFFLTISVGFLTRVTGKAGKSSHDLVEKVLVNAVFFRISGFWVGFGASTFVCETPPNEVGTLKPNFLAFDSRETVSHDSLCFASGIISRLQLLQNSIASDTLQREGREKNSKLNFLWPKMGCLGPLLVPEFLPQNI